MAFVNFSFSVSIEKTLAESDKSRKLNEFWHHS